MLRDHTIVGVHVAGQILGHTRHRRHLDTKSTQRHHSRYVFVDIHTTSQHTTLVLVGRAQLRGIERKSHRLHTQIQHNQIKSRSHQQQ